MKQKTYFENLDSLRAVAALLVIFYHFTLWFHFPDGNFYAAVQRIISFNNLGGPLAVRFFFVLSGFLITYLMFEEQKQNGKFSIKNFYIRRVLRIFPVYYLSLIIGFIIYPLLMSLREIPFHEVSNPVLFSLFLANFDVMYNNSPVNGLLGLQWSVAVEEQFYLLAPALFLLAYKKYFSRMQLLFIAVSYLFYIRHWNDGTSVPHYHTLSVLSYLAFGSLLAWACSNHFETITKWLNKISGTFIFIVYSLCLIFIFFFNDIHEMIPFINAIVLKIITTIFFGFIILEQNYSEQSVFKMGRIKILAWLGKISYGIYIYHMTAIYLVIYFFKLNEQTIWFQMIAALLLTIAISSISFFFIEKYFRQLKRKFD